MALAALLAWPGGDAGGAALEWRQGRGFRFAPVEPAPSAGAGFEALAPEKTGVQFVNHLDYPSAARNRVLQNGSGVAVLACV